MLDHLTTETRNQNSMELDSLTPLEIVQLMNQEDQKVALAVETQLTQIAQTVSCVVEAFQAGARLIYVGAGTSGRLGVLDAVECRPTFGVDDDIVIGLIAGGEKAFVKAVEGAEDDAALGENDMKQIKLTQKDVLIGLAASGRTPYVVGALDYAKKIGAKTAAISCNSDSEISKHADIVIEAVTGPEVLTGSTRLKAGTAQKMILNMISTASMVGIGKAYQNLMVDVQQTNEKLHERAKRIVMQATDILYEEAEEILQCANNNPKLAIVMHETDFDVGQAEIALEQAGGFVKKAIRMKKG